MMDSTEVTAGAYFNMQQPFYNSSKDTSKAGSTSSLHPSYLQSDTKSNGSRGEDGAARSNTEDGGEYLQYSPTANQSDGGSNDHSTDVTSNPYYTALAPSLQAALQAGTATWKTLESRLDPALRPEDNTNNATASGSGPKLGHTGPGLGDIGRTLISLGKRRRVDEDVDELEEDETLGGVVDPQWPAVDGSSHDERSQHFANLIAGFAAGDSDHNPYDPSAFTRGDELSSVDHHQKSIALQSKSPEAEAGDGSPNEDDVPPRNKKRKDIACARCRRHKLKCLGGNPCPACVKKNTPEECVYVDSIRRRGRGKKTLLQEEAEMERLATGVVAEEPIKKRGRKKKLPTEDQGSHKSPDLLDSTAGNYDALEHSGILLSGADPNYDEDQPHSPLPQHPPLPAPPFQRSTSYTSHIPTHEEILHQQQRHSNIHYETSEDLAQAELVHHHQVALLLSEGTAVDPSLLETLTAHQVSVIERHRTGMAGDVNTRGNTLLASGFTSHHPPHQYDRGRLAEMLARDWPK